MEALAVSAVCFLNDREGLLLLASGPYLRLSSIFSSEFISKCRIFEDGTIIHGIRVVEGDSSVAYCFGRHRVACVSISREDGTLEVLAAFPKSRTWIRDVCVLKASRRIVIVGYAYLKVTIFCQDGDSVRVVGSASLNAQISSLLYSQRILYRDLNEEDQYQVSVISGTAFGKIVIWNMKFHIRIAASEAEFEILDENVKETPIHDGVVFHIGVNKRMDTLVTTSDDRSVRVWDIDSPTSQDVMLRSKHYGHRSRVWMAEFLGDDGIVSVGEDGITSIFIRNEEGSERLFHFSDHSEHNCRVVAVSNEVIATGCEDGTLHLRPVQPSIAGENISRKNIGFSVGRMLFMDKNSDPRVLLTSLSNQLFMTRMVGGSLQKLSAFGSKIMAVKCVVLSEIGGIYFVAVSLASRTCQLLLVNADGEVLDTRALELSCSTVVHKTFLVRCRGVNASSTGARFLVVSTGKKNTIDKYLVEMHQPTHNSKHLEFSEVTKLDMFRFYGSSPFETACLGNDVDGDSILILGRYTGSLFIEKYRNAPYTPNELQYCLQHARDTIRHLNFSSESKVWTSASLDGQLRQFTVSKGINGVNYTIHMMKSYRYPPILGVHPNSHGNSVLVTRTTSTTIKLLNMECGSDINSFTVRNAHDGFDVCVMESGPENIIVITTKGEKLLFYSFSRFLDLGPTKGMVVPSIGIQWGGKRLYGAVAYVTSATTALCTACEDEHVRLYNFEDNLKLCCTFDANIGSIFSICDVWSGKGERVLAVGGAHSCVRLLRVQSSTLSEISVLQLDDEPYRVVSLHSYEWDGGATAIVASLSSGDLKLLILDRNLEKIVKQTAFNRPSLALSVTCWNNDVVLAGWSDGLVTGLRMALEEIQHAFGLFAHQRGVNGLTKVLKLRNRSIFASCGEDQLINVYSISYTQRKGEKVPEKGFAGSVSCVIIQRISKHYTSVVGLLLIPPSYGDDVCAIVSVSIDGSILVHGSEVMGEECSTDHQFTHVKRIKSSVQGATSAIGLDIGDRARRTVNRVVILGGGFEVLEI